jgi:hypothetical protein
MRPVLFVIPMIGTLAGKGHNLVNSRRCHPSGRPSSSHLRRALPNLRELLILFCKTWQTAFDVGGSCLH